MKNPDIASDEHDYITIQRFNVRLLADESVKIRINDLWPPSNSQNLEKSNDSIFKIAKINTLMNLGKNGHSNWIE